MTRRPVGALEKEPRYLHDEPPGVHHPDPAGSLFFTQPLLGHGHDEQVSDAQSSLAKRCRLKCDKCGCKGSTEVRLTSPAPWNTKVCSLSLFLVIFRAAKTPATATEAVPETQNIQEIRVVLPLTLVMVMVLP